MVAPGHEDRFTGATRTPLLTVRYLAAARAWLTRNPNTDLRAMLPVLRAGITPDGWAWLDPSRVHTRHRGTRSCPGASTDHRHELAERRHGHPPRCRTRRAGSPRQRVTDLIAAGLTKTVAQQWVNLAADLTADQVRNLHTRGFHPTEADAAVRQVGYDTALKYADAGLVTGTESSFGRRHMVEQLRRPRTGSASNGRPEPTLTPVTQVGSWTCATLNWPTHPVTSTTVPLTGSWTGTTTASPRWKNSPNSHPCPTTRASWTVRPGR